MDKMSHRVWRERRMVDQIYNIISVKVLFYLTNKLWFSSHHLPCILCSVLGRWCGLDRRRTDWGWSYRWWWYTLTLKSVGNVQENACNIRLLLKSFSNGWKTLAEFIWVRLVDFMVCYFHSFNLTDLYIMYSICRDILFHFIHGKWLRTREMEERGGQCCDRVVWIKQNRWRW